MSTVIPGFLWISVIMRLAVFLPTPGSLTRFSILFGTLELKSLINIWAAAFEFLDFVL